MVVEPCVLCHVRIECLGVLGRGIYILGVCMGGAMREWYCQVHYGLCLCLLMFDILQWSNRVLASACTTLMYLLGGYLCVYLCNMMIHGGKCRFLIVCIGCKVGDLLFKDVVFFSVVSQVLAIAKFQCLCDLGIHDPWCIQNQVRPISSVECQWKAILLVFGIVFKACDTTTLQSYNTFFLYVPFQISN